MRRALVVKSLRDHLRSIIGWCTGILLLIVVQLSVYPSIRDTQTDWAKLAESFPEALRKIFRMDDYTTAAGYLSTELMSFTVPFIFIALGAAWGARIATEDQENGTADLVLSLPISRAEYVASRFVAALTVMVAASATFVTSLLIGARLVDMDVAVSRFVAGGIVLLGLGTLMMTVAAAVGAATGRRGASFGITMSVGVALFVQYSLGALVEFVDRFTAYNPMQWAIGSDPFRGGLDRGYLGLTVALMVPFAWATFRSFSRRDIAG